MRKNRYTRFIVVGILSLSLLSVPAVAQAPALLSGFTGGMNKAINSLVRAKMARWGFAANDPRIGATARGLETGLTVLAGAGIGVGTAFTWPALLAAAGISALVAAGIDLVSNDGASLKWVFGANGTVTQSSTSKGFNPSYPSDAPLVAGEYGFWQAQIFDGYDDYGQPKFYFMYSSNPFASMASCYYSGSTTRIGCNHPDFYGGVNWSLQPANSPVSSDTGFFSTKPPPPPVTVAPVSFASLDEAAKAVPAALMEEKITPEMLAAAVNAAWKAGDQSVSGGVPWSASDPVTPADAEAWISANPAQAPTVRDLTTPANAYSGSPSIGVSSSGLSTSMPSGSGDTYPAPGTTPETEGPPVTPGEGEKIDWGPNPNIAAPVLEAAPTAAAILDPVFNIMPSLKAFAMPAHAGVCPTASFSVYGTEYSVTSHCALLESNRSVLAIVMTLVFTLAATFIVLRA